MNAIADLCTSSILLENGCISKEGSTSEIIDAYITGSRKEFSSKSRVGTGTVEFKELNIFQSDSITFQVNGSETYSIRISLNITDNFENRFKIGISIHNSLGDIISILYSNYYNRWFNAKDDKISISNIKFPLYPGNYFIRGVIQDELGNILDWPDFNLIDFHVASNLTGLKGDSFRTPILLNVNWE
jgi:hypothetical protein